jgi:cell division protein FtsL
MSMTDKNKLLLHITLESLVVAGVIVYFQNKTNKLEQSISEHNQHITSLNAQYQSVVAKLESQYKEITAMKTTIDTQKATLDKLTYLITDLYKDTSVNRLCQGIPPARSFDQHPLPQPVHIPDHQPIPPPVPTSDQYPSVRSFDQHPFNIPDQQPPPQPVHIPDQQPPPVLTPDFKPQLPTILEGKESGGYDSLDEELEEEFNLLVKEEKDNIHNI